MGNYEFWTMLVIAILSTAAWTSSIYRNRNSRRVVIEYEAKLAEIDTIIVREAQLLMNSTIETYRKEFNMRNVRKWPDDSNRTQFIIR